MDPPPSSTLTGTLVKNRKVSKHLAFADLLLADTAEHIELVIKTSDEIPCVKTAMKGARLGDTVDVLGAFESANGRDHRSFKLAAPYVVVSRWAATSALPFTPVFTLCQATAGAAENAGTVLCKYYTAEKACPRGESCPYVHTEDKEMRGEYFSNKREHARMAEAEVVGNEAPASNAAKKSRRAEVFADWLVETFGLEGGGEDVVLDVAGGRGDTCFELSALRGILCTTVDPRGRKLNKKQLKHVKKLKKEGKEDPALQWGSHVSGLFGQKFFSESEGIPLRSRVRLIIGLHPDQATEHIVDVGLEEGMDFAILPCCVFPIQGGSMDFGEWVEYLMSKDSGIKKEYLSCDGKNLVLYKKGEKGERRAVINSDL